MYNAKDGKNTDIAVDEVSVLSGNSKEGNFAVIETENALTTSNSDIVYTVRQPPQSGVFGFLLVLEDL